MRKFIAFHKKDWMEQVRSGRITILAILFLLFGIMNPAIAKLTPWLLKTLSDSLAENGMTVTAVEVDAMTSWTQFFKNIPMGLIAFVLLESGIFTKEYESGTLIPVLTKGLERYKVVLSKAAVLFVLWSACYYACFAVTYGYNAYFWDNSVAENLLFAVFVWWLAGVFVLSLLVFFSSFAPSGNAVLVSTVGVFLAFYLASFIPKVKAFLPAKLMESAPLLTGIETAADYSKAVITTAVLCTVCIAAAVPLFNKRKL